MIKRSRHSLFARIPKMKDPQVRAELGRAHLLVALLSVILIVLLFVSLMPGYAPNPTFTIIAAVLLIPVALFSFGIFVGLRYLNKK